MKSITFMGATSFILFKENTSLALHQVITPDPLSTRVTCINK